MHIIHIASELAPIAKVGGLGDVVLGLSRALTGRGQDVDVIIPKYDCIDSNEIRDFVIDYHDLTVTYHNETFHNTVWKGWVDNLKVYFIEPHNPKHFFNRGCFYGCHDDAERFIYFSKVAFEFLLKKEKLPDIIHLHDWQTAPLASLINDLPLPNRPKTVFTIHNIEYQGKCSFESLKGIQISSLTPFEDPSEKRVCNLMKGACLLADFVTTVSPTYAKEVLGTQEGRSLDKVLLSIQHKFKGILNGIDYDFWNPEKDRYLPAHFSPREIPSHKGDLATLDKKGYVKKVLREKFALSEEHKPIVACITRLVPQKGVELIKHALKRTLELNGQFILLGSSPIPEISREFHDLKIAYADNPLVHLILHHQEDLAHLIYAGADLFIVPSLFEPCGLTQMIALKYGTIPIVRKTGGLGDTIVDVDYSGKPFDKTNGYVFEAPNFDGVNSALDRALKTWFDEPDKWHKLIIQGMHFDFSWKQSSLDYLDIYKKLEVLN